MTEAPSRAGPAKISVAIRGHRTSLSLEPAFWQTFRVLCRRDGVSPSARLAEIDRDRGVNLSSAVRLWVLERLLDDAQT